MEPLPRLGKVHPEHGSNGDRTPAGFLDETQANLLRNAFWRGIAGMQDRNELGCPDSVARKFSAGCGCLGCLAAPLGGYAYVVPDFQL